MEWYFTSIYRISLYASVHYDHILKALEAAAKRGVPVRIVLAAPDKVLLAGSNDETQFPGMPGLTRGHAQFSQARPLVVCRQGLSAEYNVGLSTSLRRAYAGDAIPDLDGDA
jgi:hypothetical protein